LAAWFFRGRRHRPLRAVPGRQAGRYKRGSDMVKQ